MGKEIKKDYSASLLNLAVGKKVVSPMPLGFSNLSTKSRISNVLSYKKRGLVISGISLVML